VPLLTQVEAAIKLGVGVELIEYFINHCPKPCEDRKLRIATTHQEALIDEKELLDFQRYLNEPWPKPPKGCRPHIPDPIKDDIRRESHLGCAICGHMDNGEVAHIEPVSITLNNSPDNLIYLCPNHHTKYDYGFKPASNVTLDEVRAAKLVKRRSRQRMLKFEANATRLLQGLIQRLARIEEELKKETNATLVQIHLTEAKQLMAAIPDLTAAAEEQAKKDRPETKVEELVVKNAPTFARLTAGVQTTTEDRDIRTAMSSIVSKSHQVLIDIDEVECPHCCGRGMTGLVGDLCVYCRGSCVVTQEELEEYDPKNIDEVECPHCGGRGTIGITQNLCKFCRGSCVVTGQEAEDYEPQQIDETDCPHCNGRGTTGRRDSMCAYCRGDCVVTRQEARDYNADHIDEVECPHCNGRGAIGYRDMTCVYCMGDCVVTAERLENYDPNEIDEVDCPHCNGYGTTGLRQNTCAYSRGDCVVSRQVKEEYDVDGIDEVECPHCHGRGTTGLVGDICKLCKGDCTVSNEIRMAYIDQRGIQE
jgi:RecJ-like exonuclease